MKVKTVSVTYDRKFNLGDYNSASVGVTLWADVEGDDDHTACVQQLQADARDLVRAEYQRMRAKATHPAVNGSVR